MRGVILAGGTGSRLGVLTKTINKHCLPVYDRPMIFWPLGTLLENSIEDITIVSTPDGVGQLARLLGSGKEHGCRFTYKVQDQPGGIAQALSVAIEIENHDGSDTLAVILGDNVFLPSPRLANDRYDQDAKCFLSHQVDGVEHLRQFGVPSFHGSRLESIEEKPEVPKSEYAVTGLYVFGTKKLKNTLRNVHPSRRGEVEITEVLNIYAMSRTRTLRYDVVDGFWGDAGTVEGMAECSLQCSKEVAK